MFLEILLDARCWARCLVHKEKLDTVTVGYGRENPLSQYSSVEQLIRRRR